MIGLRWAALAAMMAVVPVAACDAKPGVRPAAVDAPPPQLSQGDDPELVDAMRRAQETLPLFWRVYDGHAADEGSYYLVKAGFPVLGGEEHLWLVVQGHSGDQVRGILVNEPKLLPNVHIRDMATVKTSQISDWSYDRNGRKYGNFTTRLMIKRMTPQDAAGYTVKLSETPLEPGDR